MARIKIIDRSEMNAEQGRVYDAAKAANNPLGGPYYAYIHLPKVFEAAQGLRGALASGPLSRREAQIVNLTVARHWGARYPWWAQVRASLAAGIEQPVIDAINKHRPDADQSARADLLCGRGRTAREQSPARRDLCGRGNSVGTRKPGGARRHHRQFLDDLHRRQQLRSRPSGRPSDAAGAVID